MHKTTTFLVVTSNFSKYSPILIFFTIYRHLRAFACYSRTAEREQPSQWRNDKGESWFDPCIQGGRLLTGFFPMLVVGHLVYIYSSLVETIRIPRAERAGHWRSYVCNDAITSTGWQTRKIGSIMHDASY